MLRSRTIAALSVYLSRKESYDGKKKTEFLIRSFFLTVTSTATCVIMLLVLVIITMIAATTATT